MIKKRVVNVLLYVLLSSSVIFAQTAALDAQQKSLDAMNQELEEAYRTALINERADQLAREAFEQQDKELSEQEMHNNIERLQEQITLENERAKRQAEELQRIDDLRAKIAVESEKLRTNRLEEHNRQIELELKQIEDLKRDRIAHLQSQIDQEQKELEELQSQLDHNQKSGQSTQSSMMDTTDDDY